MVTFRGVIAAVIAVGVAAVVGAGTSGTAAPQARPGASGGSAPMQVNAPRAQRDQPRGVPGRIAVEVGRVRLRDTPPSVSAAYLAAQDKRIAKANPDFPVGGPAPVPYETGPQTLVPGSQPQPDPTPPTPPAPRVPTVPPRGDPGTGGTTGGGVTRPPRRGVQRANAAGDFDVFRRTAVISGTAATPAGTVVNTSSTNEPTVANDRDGILFTGNWYAAWSEDEGTSWKYISPSTDIGTRAGGFCCDQVVVSAPRDGYSMLLWNLQYTNDANGNNAFRILSLRGRSALGSLEYCSWTVTPAWAGYGGNRWFDFEILGISDKWLYVTTNVFNTSNPAVFQGSEVIRLNLDDLEDCVDAGATRWARSEYHIRPVQGAGSTMYLGTLVDTNTVRMMRVPDSSSTISTWDRDVTTFASQTASAGTICTAPDGSNPCGRFLREVNAAYVSGSEVGLMWTQGNNAAAGLPMPSTRIARFRTSDMTLTNEHTIWNASYAWALPAVTVNGSGDKGGTIQALGGTQNTRTQAFLIDGYTPDWQPLPNAGLNGGTNGPTSNRWGDYFGVQPFRGCSDTFLGAYAYLSGGGGNGSAVGEEAWFGREGNACPDLRVTGVVVAVPKAVKGGDAIAVSDVTQNIGSEGMPASVTAYYLSHNDAWGSADKRIGQRDVPALSAGASNSGPVAAVNLPAGAIGTYYVIACADDGDPTDEVSDSEGSNCRVSTSFSVTWNPKVSNAASFAMQSIRMVSAAALCPGGASALRVAGLVKGGRALRPDIGVFITLNPPWPVPWAKVGGGVGPRPSPVKAARAGSPGEWSFQTDVTARIPAHLPPGRYALTACVGDPTPRTCRTLPTRLIVAAGPSVPAVVR